MLDKIFRSILGFFSWFFHVILDSVRSRVYSNKIVFNCAWEDPILDLQALELKDTDNVMIITSAGCNVLTYVLQNPNHIYAIDMNPCQNAVLQLKIASIKELDYPTFWKMWGTGKLPGFTKNVYPNLRKHLSTDAQEFWDKHTHYFEGKGFRNTFYWRGCSGALAYMTTCYLYMLGISKYVDRIFEAETIADQKAIYEKYIKSRLWNPVVNAMLSSSVCLSILNGVPAAQQNLLENEGSVAGFIKRSIETILTELPLKDNYFYRVYLKGEYTKDCCPEFLKEANFNKLKAGLVNKISTHTTTITQFLKAHSKNDISRFVLLDHMDWMAEAPHILSEEWNQILANSTDDARYLWRSASETTSFVGETAVTYKGKNTTVANLMEYHQTLAEKLHKVDRVHTYTSFYIAHLKA